MVGRPRWRWSRACAGPSSTFATGRRRTPKGNPELVARFSGDVDDYERYRPRYPDAAFAAFLPRTRPLDAADIGAGTGIATQHLVRAGARVIAIEPNAAMAERAQLLLPTVDVRAGTAEATGLPDRSVDVVTMFQAFHWCDGLRALAEFARILRPGGIFAVAWNRFERDDAFTRDYEALTDRYDNGSFEEVTPPNAGTAAMLAASPHFENARALTFANAQLLDRESLRGRLRSTSYLPKSGPQRDAMLAEADALWNQYRGKRKAVPLVYNLQLTYAKRVVVN